MLKKLKNRLPNRQKAFEAYLNATYYVTGIKHVITNSGTHETALSLTQIAPLDVGGKSAVARYYSWYKYYYGAQRFFNIIRKS